MIKTPIQVEATYENGVFVPASETGLEEHKRVRLTVEALLETSASSEGIISRRRQRRINLYPDLAEEIASMPEFHPDEA